MAEASSPDGRTSIANPQWLVLRTKPHQEDRVEKQAARLDVGVFLPRIIATVRAGRHRQKRVVPMFPGYVFVDAEVGSGGKRMRYVPGALDFLRSQGDPQPVPPSVIATIRSRVGDSGVFVPPLPHFEPGARLRISEGPLEGLDVIFERELSGTERVAVLLTTMNLPARVVLSSAQLAGA